MVPQQSINAHQSRTKAPPKWEVCSRWHRSPPTLLYLEQNSPLIYPLDLLMLTRSAKSMATFYLCPHLYCLKGTVLLEVTALGITQGAVHK